MVLIWGIQLQFEARQCVRQHDLQGVVQDPGAETGAVLAYWVNLHLNLVQVTIHLVRLQHVVYYTCWRPKQIEDATTQIKCSRNLLH